MTLFECVPNLSEGRDASIVQACADAAAAAGARVLHRTSDPVHNRSVLTMAGSASELLAASVALAGIAVERIDLRVHAGVHPRIGALDVLPFVPLGSASMAQAVRLARDSARAIWERYRVPSFFYGEAASVPERRDLAVVRRGGFEGLERRFARPGWHPDVGDVPRHPSAGAVAVGARSLLVAFNVDLSTGDLTVAKGIAAAVRERGGGLRTLKALGFRLSAGVVQVSLNVTDYHATPLYRVAELIRALAAERGVAVLRCELIGALPYDAVEATARYYLGVLP